MVRGFLWCRIFVCPQVLPVPGQKEQVWGTVSMVGLRRGVLQCWCSHWRSPPALCCQLWGGEQCLVVTLYVYTSFLTVTVTDCHWLLSALQKAEWEQWMWHSCTDTRPVVQTVFAEVSIRKISRNRNGIHQHNLGLEKRGSKSALVCEKPFVLRNTTCSEIQDWNQRLFLWSGSTTRT